MTLQEYIDKAGCCAGQMAYEAIIDEQDGKDCYVKKQHQARILLLIRDALLCVQNGGDCLTEKQTQLLYERIQQMCGCCCAEFVDIDNSVPVPCDVTTLDASVMFCGGTQDPPILPYILVVDILGQFKFMQFYYTYEYSADAVNWILFGGNTWKQEVGDFEEDYYRITAYCFEGSSTSWVKIIVRDEDFNFDFSKVAFFKVGNNLPQDFFSQPFEFWFPYNQASSLYVVSPILRLSLSAVTVLPIGIPTGLHQSFTIDSSWFIGVTDYKAELVASVHDYTNYAPTLNLCTSSIIEFEVNMIPEPVITASGNVCTNLYPYALYVAYGDQDSDTYDTYQWYKDGVALPGETADTYSADVAGTYNCVVTKEGYTLNTDNCVLVSVNPVPITIEPVFWNENPNLITNGDFATDDSGWNVGAGWTWVGGEMVHSSGTAVLSQDGYLVNDGAGNAPSYEVSFNISGTTGSVDVYLGNLLINTYAAGAGVVTTPSGWGITTSKINFLPTNDFNGGITDVSVIYSYTFCTENEVTQNEDFFVSVADGTIYIANNNPGFTLRLSSDNADELYTFVWLGYTPAVDANRNYAFFNNSGLTSQLIGVTAAGCISESNEIVVDKSLPSAVPTNGDVAYLPFDKTDLGGGTWRISLASNVGVPSGYVYDQNISWYRIFNQDTGLTENTLIASGVSFIDVSVGGCYSYQCDGLLVGGFLCFLKL